MIRNPAGNPGSDGGRDPWRRQDGPAFRPSPWIVAPPSQRAPSVHRAAGPVPARGRPAATARAEGGRERPGLRVRPQAPRAPQRRIRRRRPARGPSTGGLTGAVGQTLRVVVPVTVIAIGVASGLIVSVNNDKHHAPAASFFPPATPAGRLHPASAESTRGVTLSEGRVASSGTEVVAVGAETGQLVPRAQFFVSLDDGKSWASARCPPREAGRHRPDTRPASSRRSGGVGRRRPRFGVDERRRPGVDADLRHWPAAVARRPGHGAEADRQRLYRRGREHAGRGRVHSGDLPVSVTGPAGEGSAPIGCVWPRVIAGRWTSGWRRPSGT